VGAASSHGDFPVALPGITRTWFADTTASLGVVVGVAEVGGAFVVGLAAGLPLEPPHAASASASTNAPLTPANLIIPVRDCIRFSRVVGADIVRPAPVGRTARAFSGVDRTGAG